MSKQSLQWYSQQIKERCSSPSRMPHGRSPRAPQAIFHHRLRENGALVFIASVSDSPYSGLALICLTIARSFQRIRGGPVVKFVAKTRNTSNACHYSWIPNRDQVCSTKSDAGGSTPDPKQGRRCPALGLAIL